MSAAPRASRLGPPHAGASLAGRSLGAVSVTYARDTCHAGRGGCRRGAGRSGRRAADGTADGMNTHASFVVSTRTLSTSERRHLHSPLFGVVLRTAASVLLRFLLFLLLMLMAMGTLVAMLGAFANSGGAAFLNAPAPEWTMPVLAVVVWLPVLLVPGYVAGRKIRRVLWWERLKRADRARGRAQIIRSVGARYAVGLSESLDVLFVFEAGPQRVLVIPSERVRLDRALFGLPPRDDDDEPGVDPVTARKEPLQALLARLGRCAFPSSDFELHRLPHTGVLLSVRTHGAPRRPQGVYAMETLQFPDAPRYRDDYEQESFFSHIGFDALLASARRMRGRAG